MSSQRGADHTDVQIAEEGAQLTGKWKKKFYAEHVALNKKYKAYGDLLVKLLDFGISLSKAETTSCGKAGYLPSPFYVAIAGTAGNEADDNFKRLDEFLIKSFYASSSEMTKLRARNCATSSSSVCRCLRIRPCLNSRRTARRGR